MPPAQGDRPDTKTSKTLHNGIEVLELLARNPHGLTVSEVAEGIGVHRTVAHRLVRTLEEHRLCTRDRAKRVTLGPGLVALAESVEADLRAVAGPVLIELAEAQGATAHLVVPEGESEARALMVVEPRGAHAHIAFRAGRVDPVDQGSAGLALLSAMPAREREREEVTRARGCGYAVTHGEVTQAVTGVSAPVIGRQGKLVAAVGVSVLELRDPGAVGTSVAEAARRLAELIPLP